MEFPQDDAARENGVEFMWGATMLITPVVQWVYFSNGFVFSNSTYITLY